MCAIGRRGQLGLNGRMPWEGAKGPEYTADIQCFFELTRGHVILLGPIRARANSMDFCSTAPSVLRIFRVRARLVAEQEPRAPSPN